MKTILVPLQSTLSSRKLFRAGLNLENYRIVHCGTLEEAEPLLHRGLLSACILDLEATRDVRGMWIIENHFARQLPNCPLLVYTGLRAMGLGRRSVSERCDPRFRQAGASASAQ